MQATLTSLTGQVWADDTGTRIDCVITISAFGEEQLPFTADKNDVEAHGRAIFADLVAGVYGPIADYVAPPKATPASGEIPSVVL